MAKEGERYLSGKTAIITGGGSGIGKASALALASAGANVAIGSLTAEQRLASISQGEATHTPTEASVRSTSDEVRALGVDAFSSSLDVASSSSVRSFVAATRRRFGRIDIVVNAAGTNSVRLVHVEEESVWNRLLAVNLTGQFLMIKECLPGMIERRWGRIINLSSTAGLEGYARHSAYCASKFGIIGMTRCVALEVAQYNITCNALCPGWVTSNGSSDYIEAELASRSVSGITVDEFRREYAAKNIPLGRMLEPKEPASLVAYLCREEAVGLTGEALRFSAGATW